MIAERRSLSIRVRILITGLNFQKKSQIMKQQLDHMFKGSKFSKLSIKMYRTQVDDPKP
jgi:hypothetical protein